jgi:hypothetical protein
MHKSPQRPSIVTMTPNGKLSLLRRSAYVGFCLGAIVLAVVALISVFGSAILDSYGKRRIERAFAMAHAGTVLQIGELEYSFGANRLVAHSVTVSASNTSLKVARISLTGVRWARFLFGTALLVDILAESSLDVANLDWKFPRSYYGIHCDRLRASVPDSELIAEGNELRTLIGDEAFFAAHDYRTVRFHVVVPECRVSGLAYGELLQGSSYRARSVHFSRPSFDALVNRDKPVRPFAQRPLMVHEALAAIRQPLEVGNLSITNGHATYRVRVIAGADPGVLTFGSVRASIDGIANRSDAAASILIRAKGDLMDAGTLNVSMSIPIAPPEFSLHYSGSLSAMDLTRLDAFLAITQHARIKSGSVKEATFDVDVTSGRARGRVGAIYENLEIAFLDRQTGSAKGLDSRVVSFLANELKFRRSNSPDASDSMKDGKIDYAKKPENTFLQFVWFALRMGVLDVISK